MTYDEFRTSSGLSEEEIQTMVHIDNVVEGIVDNITVKDSDIHGKGVFTDLYIYEGSLVGPSLLNSNRTELGRWVNHSDTPNCKMVIVDEGINSYIEAIRDIEVGEELTMCYGTNITKQAKVMGHMIDYMRSLPTMFDEFDDAHAVYPNTGLYARHLKMKAGEVFIGSEHKEWTLNILASGILKVTNDPTKGSIRIEAPFTFESGPGSHKFAMCITDCVFMNVMRSENETADEALNRITKEVE